MKKVAIIGSCISRDLFKFDFIRQYLQVHFYAFQINIWDSFSDGLGIDANDINHWPVPNFTRKMALYDINKIMLKQLKESRCDVIVIDLFSLIMPTLLLKKNNRKVFVNNNSYTSLKDYLRNNKRIGITVKEVDTVDDDLIRSGLREFSLFINRLSLEKVVIINPVFAKKYFSFSREIIPYTDERQRMIDKYQRIIDKYSQYLHKQLPSSILYKEELGNKLASYKPTDNLAEDKLPRFYHREKSDEILFALDILQIICNVEYKANFTDILNEQLRVSINENTIAHNALRRTECSIVTNLNCYLKKMVNLENKIMIICSKGNAHKKINKIYNKTTLGLNIEFSEGQCYCAVINKKNNQIFEMAQDNAISYSLQLINSHFEKSDLTIVSNEANGLIIVGGINYSQDIEGLNIVVLDESDFSLIDSINCNTVNDDFLLVSVGE